MITLNVCRLLGTLTHHLGKHLSQSFENECFCTKIGECFCFGPTDANNDALDDWICYSRQYISHRFARKNIPCPGRGSTETVRAKQQSCFFVCSCMYLFFYLETQTPNLYSESRRSLDLKLCVGSNAHCVLATICSHIKV